MVATGRMPTFGRSPLSWRRVLAWAVVFVVATGAVAATAWAGAWFVPFCVGVAAGLAGRAAPVRSWRVVALAVVAAVIGWAIPLWALALRGRPAGATARAIAALAGLPPHAAVTVVATLLLSATQVLAGAWLAGAIVPRRMRHLGRRP
jgi:hypothetical protein